MSIDSYDPCPCNSGKKYKFCCHSIGDEISKISHLHETHQTATALQLLERLKKNYPDQPLSYITEAQILMAERRFEDALKPLQQCLEHDPDHPAAHSLLATSTFLALGYKQAQKTIYTALQKCAAADVSLATPLAISIAIALQMRGYFLAAREHFALAMRVASQEYKQNLFMNLLEFDGDDQIPYQFRGVHILQRCPIENDEQQETFEKAQRLANLGCYRLAANLFKQIAEATNQATLWKNAAFCYAWATDENQAAELFHQAATIEDDFAESVELETLAQLLDLNNTGEVVESVEKIYELESLSKFLTLLEQHPQLLRGNVPTPEQEQELDERTPVAYFQIVDSPIDMESKGEDITLENVPVVIGDIDVFDADRQLGQSGLVRLYAYEGDQITAAEKLFDEALGEQGKQECGLKAVEQDDELANNPLSPVPVEQWPLFFRWSFPQKMPIIKRRELEAQQWKILISETWSNTKLAGLDGKTPQEAVGNEELKIELTAAAYVLDAQVLALGHFLNFDELDPHLGISELPELSVDESSHFNTCSSMTQNRIPVKALTDPQLMYVFNRALLIRHPRFLYDVLIEILNRDECKKEVDLDRVYSTLTEICHKRNLREEMLSWIHKGQENARGQSDKAFESELQWKMRELSFRLEDTTDPELSGFMKQIWDRYGKKTPQIKEYLKAFAQAFDLDIPWMKEAILLDAGHTTAEGIWSPGEGAPDDASDSGQKLWLPGQS
ncbi:tetratricopeptide repeat protein [uncultured Gimesia sp.]|uniref:tetratricopeptide repeat protein n=1 Tax=uncultured Gimesia sp. TaxID=1678688 RepID=UPI0030DDA121|tara:strand:- start:20897 stop:23089 length:2193 start_codon:yes stop_codon:yes gene_type:complete